MPYLHHYFNVSIFIYKQNWIIRIMQQVLHDFQYLQFLGNSQVTNRVHS
jgi:hypothetical protein